VKLKPIFPQFVVPGAIALALAIGVSVPPAHAGFLERLTTSLIDLCAKLGALMAGVLADIVLPFLTGITNNLIANPNLPIGADAKTLWDVAITLANSFFLLALILASLAIMLRVNTGTYNIKKVLGGFISAVVLSNLSFLVVRAMLDIGDSLLNAVYELLATGQGTAAGVIESLAKIGDASHGHIWENHLEATIVFIVMVVLVIWVILSVAALLVERLIWLFLLTISAPVVFALSLLPTLNKLSSSWWEQMIKWVIAFPYSIALLVIGGKIMGLGGTGKKDLGELFQTFATAINNNPDDVGGAIMQLINKDLLLIICGMVVVYFAGRVPKMLKIGGGLTGITGAGPAGTWGAIKKGAEGISRGVSGVVAGKGAMGWAQKRARGTIGGALNLATSRIPEKAPLGLGKWKNLGTQIGSLPQAWSKYFAVTGKAREIATSQSAKQKLGFIAGSKLGRALGVSKPLLKGDVTDMHKEIADRSRSIPKFEKLVKAIEEAKDPYEFIIQMGVANTLLSGKRITPEYRQKLGEYVGGKKFTGQQAAWNELREDITPLSFYYWDAAGATSAAPTKLEEEEEEEEGGAPAGGAGTRAVPQTDEQLTMAEQRVAHARQAVMGTGLTKEKLDAILKDERSSAIDIGRVTSSEADAGQIDHLEDGTLTNLTDALFNQLRSPNPETQKNAQEKAINLGVSSEQVDLVIDIAAKTGMLLPELKLRKDLQKSGAPNLDALLTTLQASVGEIDQASADIDRLQSIHLEQASGAQATYGGQLKAHITRRAEAEKRQGKVDVSVQNIQGEVADAFDVHYQELRDSMLQKGATSATKLTAAVSPQNAEAIIGLADQTGTLLGHYPGGREQMRKEATAGDVLEMLRLGRDTTKNIKF